MNKILIFTDGSSSGNPGPGGWGAVILAHKNDGNLKFKIQNSKDDARVIELGGGEDRTTNNRMELKATIEALRFLEESSLVKKPYTMTLYSDSTYVVKGITEWVSGWIKRDWVNSKKEPVQNRDLWEALVKAEEAFDVSWKILPGHSGIAGNEAADRIATSFTMKKGIELFNGLHSDYGVNLEDMSVSGIAKSLKDSKKSRQGAKAHSYLSLVDGVLEKHYNWKDCEARVKGKKGIVRFKKALTPEEELDIIESWGFKNAND